jgi:rRNA processing protein Gar1
MVLVGINTITHVNFVFPFYYLFFITIMLLSCHLHLEMVIVENVTHSVVEKTGKVLHVVKQDLFVILRANGIVSARQVLEMRSVEQIGLSVEDKHGMVLHVAKQDIIVIIRTNGIVSASQVQVPLLLLVNHPLKHQQLSQQ